jgi:hypothetical protein
MVVLGNPFQNYQDPQFDSEASDDTLPRGYGKLGTDNTEMGPLVYNTKCEYWLNGGHAPIPDS